MAGMKPGLQFRLHQQLTLTPQLQQAIRLLQLSQLELEAELRQIAESNPLLEFAEEERRRRTGRTERRKRYRPERQSQRRPAKASATSENDDSTEWADAAASPNRRSIFPAAGRRQQQQSVRATMRISSRRTPHRKRCSNICCGSSTWRRSIPRQHAIATVLIDALNADGYLTEGLEAVLAALPPHLKASSMKSKPCAASCRASILPASAASICVTACACSWNSSIRNTPHRDLALRIVEHRTGTAGAQRHRKARAPPARQRGRHHRRRRPDPQPRPAPRRRAGRHAGGIRRAGCLRHARTAPAGGSA
jgi:RNA polymerase sigma-54 factor